MESHIAAQLEEHNKKLDAVLESVEKTRKYLLIIMWSSVAFVVAPLLVGAIMIPIVMQSFASLYSI